MAPLSVDADSCSGDVALVVFLPDAVCSRLVGPVEGWLRARTGCVPVARRWFAHTDETLRHFYPELVGEPFWPLLSRAFSWRPCLVTLWSGANAARIMPASKGVTHPAACSTESVRGRFWCDNALTNLIHVSDTASDVARELGVLRSFQADLFGASLSGPCLAPFWESGPPAPRHSAVLTLCALVMTDLSTRGLPFVPLASADGESARETMRRAEAWLAAARSSLSSAIADAVSVYLDGTGRAEQIIGALKSSVPVGSWEELVLTAGVQSRSEWLQAPCEG